MSAVVKVVELRVGDKLTLRREHVGGAEAWMRVTKIEDGTVTLFSGIDPKTGAGAFYTLRVARPAVEMTDATLAEMPR